MVRDSVSSRVIYDLSISVVYKGQTRSFDGTVHPPLSFGLGFGVFWVSGFHCLIGSTSHYLVVSRTED